MVSGLRGLADTLIEFYLATVVTGAGVAASGACVGVTIVTDAFVELSGVVGAGAAAGAGVTALRWAAGP